jgi:2,5-diketo-D-gluconate reductase B
MIHIDLINGGRMPALGFGTWQLRGGECTGAVRQAAEIGYRHIDTAQIYENEAEVGAGIAQSAIPRGEFFVTTKLWMNNLKAARVKQSAEESLEKLGMDYVDMLLIHWPSGSVKMSETLGAMQELLGVGKTKAIGVSNFPVAEMRQAVEEIKAPIANNQVEYHALLSQKPVLDYVRAHGIAVTAYSPLARGKLKGQPLLERLGAKYGKSASQVGLRWLVQQPGVAAIPKAGSEEHIRANFAIFDFALEPQEMDELTRLGGNQRLIDPEWSPRWDAA